MREIALDTETTGLDPASGHRIVEIGCVEIVNGVPSGNNFQRYVNPEREMPAGAFDVHGLSDDFLADKPPFAAVAPDFLDFIADSRLIIHNAEFDLGFLNAEFERLGLAAIPIERATDTVRLARRKFPGARASLDDLCRRFEIDNSERTLHGALKDAMLLAAVYLELIGGRQPGLELAKETGPAVAEASAAARRAPRSHAPTAEEEAAHEAFLRRLEDPVWRN
jgi:DNA polymerase-3 subunit epsilon